MVQLMETDVDTKEVLGWKGLHVFHYPMSSCLQKLRIFLNLKGLEWHSHPIDLVNNEHLAPYYLGINPRGLVPAIIDDGVVHIESNDIIVHLDKDRPGPRLAPAYRDDEVAAFLAHENDLHLDLRTLTFRFLFDPGKPTKSRRDLAAMLPMPVWSAASLTATWNGRWRFGRATWNTVSATSRRERLQRGCALPPTGWTPRSLDPGTSWVPISRSST